jgi:hypothetical protein
MSQKLVYLLLFILVLSPVRNATATEGLKGEYYHASISADAWKNLVLTRIDPTVDFDWSTNSPDPSINADGFMVRWTGTIEVPNTETYTFHIRTDDGAKLWLNNQLIADTWTYAKKWQATREGVIEDSGGFALTGGQPYEIIVEYYERSRDAVCELSWSTSTLAREAIPSRYLSPKRPYPRDPFPADGAIYRDIWVSLGWTPGDFAVSHDVYFGDNVDNVVDGTGGTFYGNQTSAEFVVGFPGYPYPEGLVSGTTYYWRIVEVNDLHLKSPWDKGPVWSFSIAPKTAYNPDPADGAEFVDPDAVELSWEAGLGGVLHTVYFGDSFNVVNNAAGGIPQGLKTYNPGPLEREKVYYWRIDEFDAMATYKGDVWSFTTPGAVGQPKPINGAVDVGINAILSWTASDSAASHQIYLGTEKEVVRNADTNSPEYKGSKALGSENHDSGLLDPDATYYWRVDEVDAQGNTSVGPIWSFTTGAFLLVDDFEGYTDDDTAGQAIWQHWIDGFGVADNGAQVGYLLPPYAEQTVVHGGLQSMPLMYTNEGGVANSEATMTLTVLRDWIVASVGELSLWARGDAANAAEPLYVAISNTAGTPAVTAHDDPTIAQRSTWIQWVIPLQAFTDQGVNLTNVDKIGIGLGGKGGASAGGSGMMYIDDIRLYRAGEATGQ